MQPFGIYHGKEVNKYIITETGGIQVSVINYGAAVSGIIVPDKKGEPANIILSFDSLDGYINDTKFYIGSICGRYANRINNAAFRINGCTYKLTKNSGSHILHSGNNGFNKMFWEAALLPEGNGVSFSCTSADNQDGFPGNVTATVTYKIKNHALHILFHAATDKATPVNITSHCYFNLSGSAEKDIMQHELQLLADKYVTVNEELIPTGELKNVTDTVLDFRELRNLKMALNEMQVYDYTWVINEAVNRLKKAAILKHGQSGREMTVFTSQPGIHFYSGNFLTGSHQKCEGLCLEAQHFPDSPNHPSFPNTILQPGEEYVYETVYSFENCFN